MTLEFTNREMDVWEHTALGLSLKEIGARLGICKATVAQYRKTLYEKLSADNAVAVALAAVAHGVVPAPRANIRVVVKSKRYFPCATR